MTSPLSQINETFTGSNGAAWPNFAVHYTQTGTYSTGPSETIQTNKGRFSATTSAASTIRRHRTSGFGYWTITAGPYSNKATFVRNALTVKPGLICGLSGTDSTSNYILAQAETFSGKSTTYGLAIKKYVSGTFSTLASLSSVTGADTVANTMGIAMRTWPLGNGNLLIQAKLWNTSGGEPAWVWPTTTTAGTSTSIAGSLAFVMAAADISSFAAYGYYGMLEEATVTATAYTVDWDDTQSYIYDPSATINTNFGSLTATASAGVRRFWNTTTEKSNRFGNGADTGTGGLASWWATSGTAWSMVASSDYITSTDGTSVMMYNTTNTDHSLCLPEYFSSTTPAGGAVDGSCPMYIIRYLDADNYVYVTLHPSTTKYRLMKRVGGVDSVVDADIAGMGGYGFSQYLRLSASGSTFRVIHHNLANVFIDRKYTISDANLQTGTQVRIAANGDTNLNMTYVRVGIGSSINATNYGGLTATATATVTPGSSRLRTIGGTLTFKSGTVSVV